MGTTHTPYAGYDRFKPNREYLVEGETDVIQNRASENIQIQIPKEGKRERKEAEHKKRGERIYVGQANVYQKENKTRTRYPLSFWGQSV